jgi:signal transduction histidine kinase
MRRSRVLTGISAGVGIGITIATTLLPFVRFAYRSPTAHVAFETAESIIAFVVSYLFFGRFRQYMLKRDLVITFALGLLGASNLFFAAVPALIDPGHREIFATWAALATRMVGAAAFAYAAFAPAVQLANPKRAAFQAALLGAGTLVLIGSMVGIAQNALPALVETARAPEAFRPHIEGHPIVLYAQGLSLLLYATAALGLTRLAEQEDDELYGWFGAGAALASAARIAYLLYPSLYSNYIYVGDLLRLGSYLLYMYGATREIKTYWEIRAEAAVLRERSRLARGLHDGIAQELVFVAAQTRRLLRNDPHSVDLKRLAGASDRAVSETRRAISAIAREREESLIEAITETAEEEVNRVGARLKLELEEVDVAPETREALVRVIREAVSNALRHGKAEVITVNLATSDERFAITIEDDGSGFDPDAVADRGFGLQTMQERIAAIGGDLSVESKCGAGSRIRVELPSGST